MLKIINIIDTYLTRRSKVRLGKTLHLRRSKISSEKSFDIFAKKNKNKIEGKQLQAHIVTLNYLPAVY